MKTRSLIPALLLCLGALVAAPPNSARAETEISFQFFYDSLSPYGEWVTVGEYGTAWHPSNVDNDWSPYQEGSWAYTDAGWTWVSEEPWGDVAYHYGRWVQVNDYGWCWVPGYEWAPAWVSWRSSDNYVGWAPLPPEAEWRPSVGISVWSDSYYDVGPSNYRFCHVRDFCEPNVRTYCRPRSENYNLMGLTINITNINYNNDDRRIFCGGPNMDYLYGRTNRPVRHLRLIEEDRYQRSSVRGDEYRYSRPSVANDRYRGRDQIQNQIVRNLSNDRIDRGWHNGGRNNDDQHRDLRSRVQEQVRGLTPDNRPAKVLVKTAGGVSRDDLPARIDRSRDNKDQDKERGRLPEKPKGPPADPRMGNRDDAKTQDEVRRGTPVNPRDESPGRGRTDNTPDKKDRDDKPKADNPRQPMRADIDRPENRTGFPTPPRDNRDTAKPKDKDEGGSTRAPMTPPKKDVPSENPSRRDASPERANTKPPQLPKKAEPAATSPRREGSPEKAKPQMQRPSEPKKQVTNTPPAPRRESAPERVAPKVAKPAPPQKRVESAPRPKQPTQAPKVVRPPSKPQAPKPQSAPNKRSPESDKKKEDEKKRR